MERLIAAFAMTVFTATVTAQGFESQLAKKSRQYGRFEQADTIALALQGRLTEALAKLESAVPGPQKTAVDDFIQGNMLYAIDPQKSFEYHQRAYVAYPRVASVRLEMAMQLQRRGDCNQARPLYEAIIDDPQLRTRVAALLAQCHVQLGAYSRAVETWRLADFANHHAAIDVFIHDVFGDSSPLARHAYFINEVRAGRKESIRNLLQLDLEWNESWWDAKVNWDALNASMSAIEGTFGKESPEATETRILIEVAKAEAEGEQAVNSVLQRTDYVSGTRLPTSSFVARRMIAMALRSGSASAGEILARHGSELSRRMRLRDKDAMDILAHLHAATENWQELAKLDLSGWREFQDPDYALSSLAGARRDGAIDKDVLGAAVRDFPEDSRILLLAYMQARESGEAGLAQQLARVIDKEYRGLRNSRSRYADALNAMCGELATLTQ